MYRKYEADRIADQYALYQTYPARRLIYEWGTIIKGRNLGKIRGLH